MNNKKGFTLIEMMVAIALFSIVIAIAVGGFVNALRTQRQVASLLATQSNVSLALEQMARDIRTGYLFCHDQGSSAASPSCGCSGTSGPTWTCNELDYFSATGDSVQYRLHNGALEKGVAGVFDSVTGDNVSVQYLTFVIQGNLEGDQWAPRVTVALGVAPSSTDTSIKDDVLNLQTSVSARQIDCDISTDPVTC